MADDGGARRAGSFDEAVGGYDRRGPMRPGRLESARSRMSGATVARLFQLGDVGGLLVATVLTAALGGRSDGALLLGAAPLAALFVLLALRAYRMSVRDTALRRLARVAAAAVAGAAAMSLAAVLLAEPVDRRMVGGWLVLALLFLAVLHSGWAQLMREARRRGLLTPNVVVVGATPAARRLIERALRTGEVNVLGVFDDRRDRVGPALAGVPVLGSARDLADHRLLPFVDRIVITVPRQASARIAQLLERLAPVPNPIALLLEGDSAESEARAVSRIADLDLVQISGPPRKFGYHAGKRAIDLILGVLLLLAFAPLMGLVAVAIRLDSPGPILFRQRRHGYMNEEIVVWKFRSMRVEQEDATASRQVTAGDDRVTRVGRIIRRTSLDELPQLFNVLRGEMSLVGPRPHAIGMLTGGAQASKLVETYAHRHRIKPGLTGWAAVNGSRGPVDTPEAVRRRVALDLEYVERQSLWLDLAILLRTAPCLLGDSGAVR